MTCNLVGNANLPADYINQVLVQLGLCVLKFCSNMFPWHISVLKQDSFNPKKFQTWIGHCKALNANDIETNPGPPKANFTWLCNYISWDSDVHRSESIIRDTNREIQNLYDDSKVKIIPEALYNLENLLILQKVQNISLTYLKNMLDSEVRDKISHLYNEWCIKVREQEQEKHATEAALSNAFIGGEVSSNLSLSGPSNLPENLQQDLQQENRSQRATNVILENDHEQLHSEMPNRQTIKRSVDNLEEASDPQPKHRPSSLQPEEGGNIRKKKRRTQFEIKECGIPCPYCIRYYTRKNTLAMHIEKTHPRVTVISDEEYQEESHDQGLPIGPTDSDLQELQQIFINFENKDMMDNL